MKLTMNNFAFSKSWGLMLLLESMTKVHQRGHDRMGLDLLVEGGSGFRHLPVDIRPRNNTCRWDSNSVGNLHSFASWRCFFD